MANCRHDFKLIFLVFCILSVTLAGRCKNGGKENQVGGCDCTPCHRGETCEEKVNKQPKFETDQQEVTVDTEYRENELVYVASAYDKDSDEICNDVPSCPCGEITYGIEFGNEDNIFTIDPTLGIIRLNGLQDIRENERRELVLSARNAFDESGASTMVLGVRGKTHTANQYSAEINNGYDGSYHVETSSHERIKRSVNAPSNVTFDLQKEATHASLTVIKPGQRIGFILKIHFPAGTTDMLVELFAPDNNSIVMMLCDVRIDSVGGNLNYDGPGDIKLESKNNSIFYDWAVIDFGNVTNDGTSPSEHSIVIKYDAVMIQNEDTQHGNTYWVSAGAEYNEENEVWVGQASFTSDLTDPWDSTSNKPKFNFSGPNTLAVGESAIFAVDMYITYPSIGLGFDAFAPLNDTSIMSVCGIQIEGVGVNYQCGFDFTAVPSSLHQDGQPRGNARGHLDIGMTTNKGIRDEPSSVEPNLIRVEFVMKVWDDVTALGLHSIGAALELGSDQIWCGQIDVTVVARKTADIPSPSVSLAFVGNVTEVSESQPVVIEITADVGLSTGDFKLDAQSPLDGSSNPKLQVCAITFVRAGENMPCVETDREAVMSSRGNLPLLTDTATLDLGVLTNVGNWGYFNHSRNDTRNIMVLQVLVKGTEFTTATQTLDIGLTSGSGTRSSLDTIVINKAASSSLPEITETPTMNLTYKYSSGTVRIGEAVTMFYDISTVRGKTFPKFDMEFIAPNSSDSAIVAICRAEAIKVGKNTPCLTKEGINSKWQYVSQFNESAVDRATLELGSICNFEVKDIDTEDVLVLSAVFQLKPHPDATNGKQMYLSAGSMYTDSKMWIGQLSMTVDTSPYPAPPTLKKPELYVSKVGEFNAASTPIGYPATYEVLIQTYPGETIDLKLILSTTSDKISFCAIKIKAVGNNMPCVDQTIKGVITKDAATGLNKDAELTVGPVTNVGDIADKTDSGNSTFGINSLVFEVIVQSSTGAADAENLPFSVATNGVITPVNNNNLVVTSDETGISMMGNATGIDFNVAAVVDSDADYDVYKGQAKKFFIDIDTQLDTTQRVTAQIMTEIGDLGHFEIAYIGLVEVGENLGCVSREMTTSAYEKRPSSSYLDIGTLNLGYVCNTGINRNDSEANKIRIEAYARLLNNPSLNVGDTVKLSAAVNFNDQQIFIAQKDMTVKNVSEFNDLVTVNATLTNATAINVNRTTPIVMTIAQVEKIPVILNIPPFTVSRVQFDIDLPMSPTSASMTFKSLQIVGSGQNLCRYGYTEDFKITEHSTMSTTQINKVFVDMGIVSNIGITHKLVTAVPEDDIIYAEVEVQMADSDTNDHNAEMWLGLGAKIASFIIVSEHKVEVSRDGSEVPVFNFTASYDPDNSTDVYAEIDIVLEHAATSTAEYQNTVMKFNTPPYLEYKDIPAASLTTPSVTNINNNAIEINLGRFFFTDKLEMTVAFEVNSTYGVPPGISTAPAVTGVEIICNMVERNTPTFKNGSEEFTSGFMTVSGTYTTTPKASGASCTAGIIANIETCQLSSSGDDIATPDNAVFTGTGWVPPVREGTLGKLRYLQYDFGERVSLTQVDYKHTKTAKISKIQLRYSNDGKSFLDGQLLTIGATDGFVSVNSILKYKVLRLYIDDVTSPDKEVGLTVQFTGCYVDSTPTTFTCPATPTIPAEYARRSFVADATQVYVCDGTPGKRSEIDTMCFASPDGDTWKALDNRVSCMVGHNQDPKGDERLYALSHNYQYMTSMDKGETWQVVEKNHVDQVKTMSTYVQAVKVPWTGTPADTNKSLLAWQSAYYGMSPTGTFVNKFKWDTCCP
ncbi:hypothetical protein LOTGIDRAFT_171361 [Lottia gigantea]|uniref:F5/8 type C domain-containing protein n=1 Tax=Lottia gigantea TaxID=225164 RepID=V4CMI9_LOTGI|nr:hypothetical protein LOTGIDRAFT_171361 [Lottia gigantea]ESP03565.1 hypothetical protein LOTGIDRAFT_171361 [Lottia gigantea]